nr:CorA family divalent cation transporter [Lysobacter lactosilyticus]
MEDGDDKAVRVLLFDAHGEDRRVDPRDLDLSRLGEHELAWIDIRAEGPRDTAEAMRTLGLDAPDIAPLFDAKADPLLLHQDGFAARAIVACWNAANDTVTGVPWLLVVGRNAVVTAHKDALPFLDALAGNHDSGSRVGELDADSFAITLLDRMLTAYYDALDEFENRLDQLEVDILEDRVHGRHVPHLRRLRRAVSMFRRLLSSHRDLFDALRRPDFRPESDDKIDARYRAVSARYERAMDTVENARDLVIGSYELLETRLSQRTNETMRVLTFVTVLLGTLAVIAGVLGMNFQATLFDSGSQGFWITVGLMAATVVAALIVARRRGWWS